MKTFAILSLKGGVGKTTLGINLGAALSLRGKRVLLIDFDPQHDLTTSLGMDPLTIKGVEFLLERDLDFEEVRVSYRDNLDVIPAGSKLKEMELSFSNLFVKAKDSYFCHLLRNVMQPVEHRYDVVLLDCPPAVGFLTINALTYVEGIILPVQCQHLGYESLKCTVSLIRKIKRFNNPDLQIAAVVPMMYDVRNRLSGAIVERLSRFFNGALTQTRIRVNVALAEAPAFGLTIFDYRPNSHGAEDFSRLADEILENGPVNAT